MPDFAGSKTQNPRCRQRQRGFLKQRKERTRRRIRLMYRGRFFFPLLLYTVYQIFRRAQIFVGFFCSCGRPGAAGGFSRVEFLQEFLQKNKPYNVAQPEDATWKKPLLPQIKCNTKYVKLQELNYIYSIPYFLPNATAKPQNLPAVHYLGDVCIHTTKAYLQSTVASRVIVARCLIKRCEIPDSEPSTPNPLSRI